MEDKRKQKVCSVCGQDTVLESRLFSNASHHIEELCGACGKSYGFIQYDEPRIYFGKHKGKSLRSVYREDSQYLKWLLEQDWVKTNLRRKITSIIHEYERS